MKLTKENIYINLQGKSKEELTELYWLLKNNSERIKHSELVIFITQYYNKNRFISYDQEIWQWGSSYGKQEVTIQQLKEILQPMENKEEQLIKEAKERGFLTEGNEFYSCFDDKNELRIIKPYDSESEINLYLDISGRLRYLDGLKNEYNESLCSNPAIYKDGVWAEIKNNNLTLTEQLEKAKAEVERLQKAIEEDNKIKVGDLVKCANKGSSANYIIGIVEDLYTSYVGVGGHWYDKFEKITDKELINKLNELIK